MAQIIISNLPTGIPKGTDEIPGTDPTDKTEASTGTTKKYFRSSELNFALTAMGLTTYAAVVTSSTTSLTVVYANGTLGVGATLTNAGAQTPLVLDGIAVKVNDRVLIKNQAAPAQNGIYTVFAVGTSSANWVLVRATDYNQASNVIQYGVMLINEGATYGGLLFQETGAGPFTIGTTPITFAQFISAAISLPVSLADGGTGAALTASNGGIFYSNASTGAVLAGTSTALQMLQSGASSAPSWSTATWPAATVTNQLLYSSTTNTVAGLTTAASAGLLTNAGGVPGWVAATGTGAPVLATSPTIVTPTLTSPIIGQIKDSNGLSILTFTTTPSAVNFINIANQATTFNPIISFTGTDTNVGGVLMTKGTGQINLNSANTTQPVVINSGTTLQHSTTLNFANTANTRAVTFPDASGTIAFTGTLVVGNVVKASSAFGVADAGFALKANTTAVYGGGASSNAFTATGLTTSSIVTAVNLASTNAVSIVKAVPTADTLTITWSGDPGASTQVSWVAITPAV